MRQQIKLFGGFALFAPDGAPVRLPTRKSWALLAYLVQSGGREIPREELAALLWPRSGEDQARASLRQELAVLKKALLKTGIGAFRAATDAVAFSCPPDLADTAALEACIAEGGSGDLRRVITLYSGDFLTGLSIRSGPFDEWLWLERQRLKNRAVGALSDLLRSDIGGADDTRAMATAQALLGFDAAHEQAHRAVMRLYQQSGRRAEALQQYTRCREVLKRDLDAEPSQETEDLAAQIRREGNAQPAPTSGPTVPATERVRGTASVLCVGLCGNEDLAGDLDPDLLAKAQRAFADRAAKVIGDLRGAVVPGHGDRILALFEETGDAGPAVERAAAAAVALVNQPLRPDARTVLHPRAGIGCGTVIVEKLRSGQPLDVYGTPVHAAVRFGLAAAAGEILVHGASRQSLRGRFDTAPADPAKFAPSPPADCGVAVLRDRGLADRFDSAKTAKHLTALFGREAQLSALRTAWQAAMGGQGGVVKLMGEDGVGKSRLVHDFLQAVRDQTRSIVHFGGSLAHRHTPFHPITRHLRAELGLPSTGARSGCEAALEKHLAKTPNLPRHAVALMADLLCPQADDGPVIENQSQMADIFDAVMRVAADGAPRIVVAEDLHWFDSSSAAYLERLALQAAGAPIVIILTLRPGVGTNWPVSDTAHEIALSPLPAREARSMAAALMPDDAADRILDEIADKSGGLPLLVEELAGAARLAAGAGGNADADSVDDIVPGNVQTAIRRRIDRLSDSTRDVFQIASVLGEDVSHYDLQSVTALPGDGLRTRLRQLRDMGLLYSAGRAPDLRYEFKHAVVRETTYSTMPPERRKACHSRIAEVLEARQNPSGWAAPGTIADHFAKAGRFQRAIELYRIAGARAARLLGHHEAAALYRKALRLVENLPDDERRTALELRLLLALGPQLQASQGFGADEVIDVYDRARVLAAAGSDQGRLDRLEPVLWGLWGYCVTRADLPSAIGLAAEFVAEAQLRPDPVSRLTGQLMLGTGRFYRGQIATAQDYFDRALGFCDPDQSAEYLRRYGVDVGVVTLCYLAWAKAVGGQVKDAEAVLRNAVDRAAAGGDATTLAMAQVFAAAAHAFAGHAEPCLKQARSVIDGPRRPGQAQWRAQARMLIGRAAWLSGKPDALCQLRAGLADYTATGAALSAPCALAWIAEACLHADRLDDALARLDQAEAHSNATTECYYDPELSRLRGCVLARQGAARAEAAEAAFETAIKTARTAGSGLFELRAQISLAEFLRDNGRHENALGVLGAALAAARDPSSMDYKRATAIRRDYLGTA